MFITKVKLNKNELGYISAKDIPFNSLELKYEVKSILGELGPD